MAKLFKLRGPAIPARNLQYIHVVNLNHQATLSLESIQKELRLASYLVVETGTCRCAPLQEECLGNTRRRLAISIVPFT